MAFIAANPLRPVSNEAWEGSNLAKWYSENSLVWVSPTHNVWKREKRTGKKFGNLKKSKEVVLGLMVRAHLEETWKWIEQRATEGDGVETEEEMMMEEERVVVPAAESVKEGVARDGEDVLMDR